MLDAFAKGAGERWTEGPVIDRGLAIRLGQIAADLKAAGVSGADILRAGEFAARGRREMLTPSWIATTGRLAEAIARSVHAETAAPDDEGFVRVQSRPAGPPRDDRAIAAATDPPR